VCEREAGSACARAPGAEGEDDCRGHGKRGQRDERKMERERNGWRELE